MWCYDAQPDEKRDSAAPGRREIDQECSKWHFTAAKKGEMNFRGVGHFTSSLYGVQVRLSAALRVCDQGTLV